MIASCGLPTRLPDARARPELAGAARPLRRGQGRRNPHAASRGLRAATKQPPPQDGVARPRRPQRAEQAAPSPAAPTAIGLTENPAALARAPRRAPLDPPAPTTRPTTNITADPSAGGADGPGKSHLGLQKDPRRIDRPRPSDRRFNGVDDTQGRRPRP